MTNYVKIPQEILQMHKTVSVVVDAMFVNGMGFLVIISSNTKFTAVQYVGKQTTSDLYKYPENIN